MRLLIVEDNRALLKNLKKGLEEEAFAVDPSRTEATGGSGLGLSIVRKIVEAHGGRVTATSDPEGSVVTVFLPGP